MDMNQVYQDSMMVINSTQMKLSDPRQKDKLNSYNVSQSNKQSNINADIPIKNPNQLINITMHHNFAADNQAANRRESQSVLHTEQQLHEQHKETSQSLYMCNGKINDSPSTPKRNPFQSQIYPKEQVSILQKRCTTQLPQTCNSPILVSKAPETNQANSSLKQRKMLPRQSLTNQKNADQIQICNPGQLLRQDIDIPEEHIDGFIGYIQQQKQKLQQNSVVNPLSHRKPQIGSTNFNGPFKQLSNSPFRKLRQFKKNNPKLNALEQIDQLKVECCGKQIIGIQRKNVAGTNKKNLDLQYAEKTMNMSMPSFQDQKFAGSSTLYPDASPSFQVEEAETDNIKIQKMFFKTNLIDLMKKDSLTCPQSPVSEEEGILNVFVRSKDQLPILTQLDGRQQEGQVSSPTSQQMDEEEFTYYTNHLLTSSFERPDNQHKLNSMENFKIVNQSKQQIDEKFQEHQYTKSFMKTQNKRIETSNESKANSQINNHHHIYSDKTIQNSDFVKQNSDNQVDDIGEKPNTETRNSRSPGADHSRSNSLRENQSNEQMCTQTTPIMTQPIESRQQQTTALMTPLMQYQFNPTFTVGIDSFTKPRGSNPGNAKEPCLEVQSSKKFPQGNNRTRLAQNDKIQSHVQMKLQHLRDLNNDKSNRKSPISSSQLQEICQSTLPKENPVITNTNSVNKVSNTYLKTTTLDLTTSAVGSSMNIDRGDSQKSSEAVNLSKVKNQEINQDLQEVHELDPQMTTMLINQQSSPNSEQDHILIAKKIKLQPRDTQTQSIDQQPINWIQSGRPLVNIQIQNHHNPNESQESTEDAKQIETENDQSIYLNKHVTGGLPALRKHPQPISSFFISKQKNNKKLQDRYGKMKDAQQDLQMILSQRSQNYSAPKQSLNNNEDMNFRDIVTTAMLKKKNFEDIINSIAMKPNTARNSIMRVCPTKYKQFEIEPPRTAAKTFRFGLQELHQQNQLLLSKKSENIKLEENFPMVPQPSQVGNKDIKISLEQLMNANNLRLHQSRQPLQNNKKINKLSVDFSRKSNSKSPRNQKDSIDEMNQVLSMREQALQSPQHVCLHIKNIQLNTSPKEFNKPILRNNKFIRTNFAIDETNKSLTKQNIDQNQDNSDANKVQKQDADSVKHQRYQFGKFKKLSPIKIANFGANKAREILSMLPNTPISSDLKNSDFRYSTDQNQIYNKQSMDEKRESNIETSYILSQRHHSRNNSHKKLISGQDNQPTNLNQPNLDSVTNISGFAHSQREQSTIIGDDVQNDKSPSNYSPFGLKSNEFKNQSQIQNHLHMLKREIKRKRESQIQESLQPLVQQLPKVCGDPPESQTQPHARSPDFVQSPLEPQSPQMIQQNDYQNFATENVLIQNSNIEHAQKIEQMQLTNNIRAACITEPSEQKQVFDGCLEATAIVGSSCQPRTDSVDLQKTMASFINQNKSRQAYDKVANFTQIRNTGYNDFYSYMDKVPLSRDDRKNKHTVKAFIQINQKKRQRDQLMKQRRHELFQQVQHVLDSSRPVVLPNSTPQNISSMQSHTNDNNPLNDINLSARIEEVSNQNKGQGIKNEEDTVEYPMSLNMSDLRNNEMQMTPNPNNQITSLRTSNATEQREPQYQQLKQSILKNTDDMIKAFGRNQQQYEENTDRVTLYKSSRICHDQSPQTQSPIPKSICGSNQMSQSFYNKNKPTSFCLVRPESDTQVK